jgi:carboxyl-terminal processing protease
MEPVMTKVHTIMLTSILSLAGCLAPTSGTGGGSDPTPSPHIADRTQRAPSRTEPKELGASHDSTAPFPQGAAAFAAAKKVLLERYYKEGLTEEDLDRAATAGMLEQIEPSMKAWNKLLSPAELAELHGDLKGEVVGVGVEISYRPETGYAEVIAVLPNAAAERAGVERGDTIVSIDGKVFRGSELRDVVAKLRGKIGESVKLVILRGDTLRTFEVKREVVKLEVASHLMLPNNVGYVRIRSFSEKTPDAVRAAVEELAKAKANALIVDLRQNPGGAFDQAVETAGVFLPKGAPVVKTKKRGGVETLSTSPGTPVLGNVPLVVLVDSGTSSGAEILAGALAEGRKAELVGSHTFGKWTVQMVDELENGWAMKYTVAGFETPGGHSFEGQGMDPDVQIDLDEKSTARALATTDITARLAADAPLKTALGLVRARN